MRKIMMTSLLLLAAAGMTPAQANYFSNPYLGLVRNIGSAPSPTPEDIRENRLPRLSEREQLEIAAAAEAAAKRSQEERVRPAQVAATDR
jgi:hypothetical protein